MKVIFFGSLMDKAGTAEIAVESVSSLDRLKSDVFEKYPSFTNQVYAIAVNGAIVTSNIELEENDEIAFMPPFAGG